VLDHQRRLVDVVHRHGRDRPLQAGARGISAFMVHKDDPGFVVGSHEKKLGIKGSPTTELHFDNCRIPGDRIIGGEGRASRPPCDPRPHPRHHRCAGRRHRPGRARRGGRVRQGAQAVRQGIAEFQGIQFMLADMAMKLEAARQMVYVAAAKSERQRPRPAVLRRGGQVLRLRRRDEGHHGRRTGSSVARATPEDHPVERMMRDAKITQIYEGTNQIQRIVMARQLLK
jgi:alkylation response protein AidB-like acyl-CoA dehydrogenase